MVGRMEIKIAVHQASVMQKENLEKQKWRVVLVSIVFITESKRRACQSNRLS